MVGLNWVRGGAGVVLALVCTAWMSGGELLGPVLGALWYHAKLWFVAVLLGLSALYCFFLEGVLVRLANQQLYTVGADNKPTGTLAAP